MKKTHVALLVCSVLMISACNQQKTLTPQEKELVGQLKQERDMLRQEITTVAGEMAQISSGLILTIMQAREETLKLSQDVVNQRIQAIETGAEVTVVTPTSKPDPDRATQLQAEIAQTKQKLDSAKANAAQYSGGLLAALSMTTVATIEQTLAQLEQQYLSAKYGLPFLVTASVEPASKAVAAPAQTSAKQTAAIPTSAPAPVVEKSEIVAADGPFGLAMGMTVDMFGDQLDLQENGIYLLDNPPKPNRKFEKYALKISDNAGLCWIKGIGKDISTNGHGFQVKSEFEELETALSEKYGKPRKIDFLTAGSIWDDAKYWMRSLQKQDRYLISSWKGGKKALPYDLSEIDISANATSGDTGYLTVEYAFSNKEMCDEELKKGENAGL